MSSKRQMIWLAPPVYENTEERIESRGHECGYCHGQGGFAGDPRMGDGWKECPMCKGCGKMDAEVNIKWKPNVDPNKQQKR